MKKIDPELSGYGYILAISCIITFIGLTSFNYAGQHQLVLSLLRGLGLLTRYVFLLSYYYWLIERICKKYGHKGCICKR
jgi:hypothetical protein